MTDLEVLAMLRSRSAAERLRGARLAGDIDPSHRSALRVIRANEDDGWVRAALDRALGSPIENLSAESPPLEPDRESALDDIRAHAVREVTETALHEIRPLLSDIELAAQRELASEGFEDSDLAKAIRRLREFLRTLNRLHDAAAPPRVVEFDIAELVRGVIVATGYSDDQVLIGRDDPVVTLGDPELLEIALINVVRNAVEASEETAKKVVITFGATDSDAWVSVLDEGTGLPGGDVWKAGTTLKSKDTNFGWGLPIAKRAVKSLGGSIHLRPREPVGTAAEIRWSLDGGAVE